MVEAVGTLKTTVISDESKNHVYEIRREFDTEGEEVILLTLYPTLTEPNTFDLSSMHLMNHSADEELQLQKVHFVCGVIDDSIATYKAEIQTLTDLLEDVPDETEIETRLDNVRKLESILLSNNNLTTLQLDDEFVDAFVARIEPYEGKKFKWYLNIGTGRGWTFFDAEAYELYDSWTLGFEPARRYRKANNQYLRESQWEDIHLGTVDFDEVLEVRKGYVEFEFNELHFEVLEDLVIVDKRIYGPNNPTEKMLFQFKKERIPYLPIFLDDILRAEADNRLISRLADYFTN